MIEVQQLREGDPATYQVLVREGRGESRHEVRVAAATRDKLTGGQHSAEALLEAAFRFLLDREPKESILGRFDITVIGRYFPEFERELPSYLDRR